MTRHLSLILLMLTTLCTNIKAQQSVDNTRIKYEDRYHGLDELPSIKYHLWPEVKGNADVVGFFDAIVNSYYIDLWYIAQANLHHEEELGEAIAKDMVVDRKNGYLRVVMSMEEPKWVECCYWRKKDGTKLVAFNFCYENPWNDQFYLEAHTSDILFYEYDAQQRLLRPIAPPIDGITDFRGISLPQEGRNLTLADGRKLIWNDGRFSLEEKSLNTTTSTAKVITPTIGRQFDFSPEAVKAFANDPDNEIYSDIYDIVGGGCSFYCGCDIGEQKASSTLKPQGKQNYNASNAHDLSYYSAWVEGAAGQGIGEWIEYTLPGRNPRITNVCVVGGIVRSLKAFKENSRPKVIDLLVNGKLYATLQLKDVYAEQWFEVPPIGYEDRENLEGKAPWHLRFVIRDVYPGTKYQDTGITEIYFDGIDVH